MVGRFLSRDPWAVDTWNPVELNRYVYAAANPATLNDPTGTFAIAGRGIFDTTISLPNIPILQGLGAVLAGMLTGLLACEMSMQMISLMELAGIDTTFVRVVAPDGCELPPKDDDDEEEKCDYRVLQYNEQPTPRPENCQAHHPMPSVWMDAHYSNYNLNTAWTILMPNVPDHLATQTVMKTWKKVRHPAWFDFPWKEIAYSEMKQVADQMLNATDTPSNKRQYYWQQFEIYRSTLRLRQ